MTYFKNKRHFKAGETFLYPPCKTHLKNKRHFKAGETFVFYIRPAKVYLKI